MKLVVSLKDKKTLWLAIWNERRWEEAILCFAAMLWKQKRHPLHFWLLHVLYKMETVSMEQSETKVAPFHFYSIDAKLPIVVKIHWIFVWVVLQHATRGTLQTQQKIVLCNFTVGPHTKMFVLNITLQSMIFLDEGRSFDQDPSNCFINV